MFDCPRCQCGFYHVDETIDQEWVDGEILVTLAVHCAECHKPATLIERYSFEEVTKVVFEGEEDY